MPALGYPVTAIRKFLYRGFATRYVMSHVVDFKTVSTVGLESSPVAAALAGLRANEARYFKNKFDHDFTLDPASNPKRRAVGFKLSEGMDVPEQLADRFKFATQKSKLAGTIRGSFFVIKGEY
jgi:hypothetical protein